MGYYYGSVHITDENAWVTDNAFITTFSPDVFNKRYLFYALKNANLRKYANSSSQPVISGTGISKVEILRPPLHIQERIADTLDKADALRQKDQELLSKYDQLAQTIFYDMFGDPVRNEKGWTMKTLEELSHGIGQYGSGAPSKEYNSGLPRYIRITDITDTGVLTIKPVSVDTNDREQHLLTQGDLLFARNGATVGKTYIHQEKNGKFIYAGYLIRFKINEKIAHPLYIFSGNGSSAFQEILSRKSGNTNYIDKLKDKLESKIDRIEEGNMR